MKGFLKKRVISIAGMMDSPMFNDVTTALIKLLGFVFAPFSSLIRAFWVNAMPLSTNAALLGAALLINLLYFVYEYKRNGKKTGAFGQRSAGGWSPRIWFYCFFTSLVLALAFAACYAVLTLDAFIAANPSNPWYRNTQGMIYRVAQFGSWPPVAVALFEFVRMLAIYSAKKVKPRLSGVDAPDSPPGPPPGGAAPGPVVTAAFLVTDAPSGRDGASEP